MLGPLNSVKMIITYNLRNELFLFMLEHQRYDRHFMLFSLFLLEFTHFLLYFRYIYKYFFLFTNYNMWASFTN